MRLIRRTSDRAQDETGAPRRILVADDDPSIATLIQITLKDPRYEIVAVKNGLEALKAFESGSIRTGIFGSHKHRFSTIPGNDWHQKTKSIAQETY